jgi:hypothetical protein
VSIVATVLFAYVIFDIFTNGKIVSNNPWAVPAFFTSTEEFNSETQYSNTLE